MKFVADDGTIFENRQMCLDYERACVEKNTKCFIIEFANKKLGMDCGFIVDNGVMSDEVSKLMIKYFADLCLKTDYPMHDDCAVVGGKLTKAYTIRAISFDALQEKDMLPKINLINSKKPVFYPYFLKNMRVVYYYVSDSGVCFWK